MSILYKTTSQDLGRTANVMGRSESRVIERAVGEWRQRLHAFVPAGGGHFEHMTDVINDDVMRRV